MGRFLILLGVLLILAGSGAMIGLLMPEQFPPVEDFILQLHCELGDRLSTVNSTQADGETTLTLYCDDNEGNLRDISADMFVTIAIAFLVPFGIGMLLVYIGVALRQREQAPDISDVWGGVPVGQMADVEVYGQSFDANSLAQMNIPPEKLEQVQQVLRTVTTAFGINNTLSERLQQLEDARQKGLISQSEYDTTRQAILDSMDDNL
ncbi:MAG: SHOCT domain-containing protein [Chloroflexota bacterium]